jgi:hypothetical protein
LAESNLAVPGVGDVGISVEVAETVDAGVVTGVPDGAVDRQARPMAKSSVKAKIFFMIPQYNQKM